jgi:5'-nucleotidase
VTVIMLTNDDGLYAPGIQALRAELEEDDAWEVWLSAPDRERSAMGHAITVHEPLFVREVTFDPKGTRGFAVSGTPADSCKLGLDELLPRRPDLVISGINRGENLATDLFYSGTVSAAIEAVINGVPAIAISQVGWNFLDFAGAARLARRLAHRVLKEGLPPGIVLNVNVPPLPESEWKGIRITRQGVRRYEDEWERRTTPRGVPYYWLAGRPVELDADPESDTAAVAQGYVSITPVHLHLTAEGMRSRLQGWER